MRASNEILVYFLTIFDSFLDSSYILRKDGLACSDNNTNFVYIEEVGYVVWICLLKMHINDIDMEAYIAFNNISIIFAYGDNDLLS